MLFKHFNINKTDSFGFTLLAYALVRYNNVKDRAVWDSTKTYFYRDIEQIIQAGADVQLALTLQNPSDSEYLSERNGLINLEDYLNYNNRIGLEFRFTSRFREKREFVAGLPSETTAAQLAASFSITLPGTSDNDRSRI